MNLQAPAFSQIDPSARVRALDRHEMESTRGGFLLLLLACKACKSGTSTCDNAAGSGYTYDSSGDVVKCR